MNQIEFFQGFILILKMEIRSKDSVQKPTLLAAMMVIFAGNANAQELLIFGGLNHERFLGCFNCNEFSPESICNEFGAGNEFKSDSIFNEFSTFGNEFSSSSPWNEFSSSKQVPVLVDRQGNFYGYFTINEIRSDAVPFAGDLAKIYDMADGNLKVFRNILCKALN